MHQPQTPQDYLDVALRAEHWIDRFRHDTKSGVIWSIAEEAPDKRFHNLYSGSAGIAIFYLELHEATGDPKFLDLAVRAGREIQDKLKSTERLPCAPAGGWGGYLFALSEIALSSKDASFFKTAAHCAQRQKDQAQEIGAGIGWIQEMPYAKLTGFEGEREIYDVAEGAAGAALAWLYAHEHGIHESALEWAVAAANRLLEVAEPAPGGLRWQLMNDIPWPFDAPNFAHGTAGVAFFMARLYELTHDQRFLDAAIAGAKHVQTMSVLQTSGHLVPHILDDGSPDRFYLGFCHGPAGTARLFYLLSELTDDPQWSQWSHGLDEGLISLGAPETRSRGLWNNISQCCCDAGIGDHAVNMWRATQNDFYLDLARRVATELVKRSVGDDTVCAWPQAEHRSQPEFIQTQTGYMQGAAGVGSFFLHLATSLKGTPVKISFPESPFNRLPESLEVI